MAKKRSSTSATNKWICVLLTVVAALVASVSVVVVVRTLAVQIPRPEEVCDHSNQHYIPLTEQMLNRLSKVITFKTISYEKEAPSGSELDKLRHFIIQSFPIIHNTSFVQLQVINNYSLFYTVKGADPSLKPYFLAAHLDVVPADPEKWDVPPFDGRVQDGFVYGRGALDDKSQFLGILECVEEMLKRGFKPRRGFYMGFGHDEEVYGYNGAREISELLMRRGVELEFLMDEGTMILTDVIKMVNVPVALVSVSEKGYATFKLTVEGTYAHSSFPPPSTSVGILAKAISRLEDNPHPNHFGLGTERTMLETLAPYASLAYKMAFSNLWLFSSVVSHFMAKDPLQNALVRTTTAVTMVNGGIKANVIPKDAWAVVNHRIHPMESLNDVLEFDKRVVNDDRVKFEILEQFEPAPISPYDRDTFGFQSIKRAVSQVFPSAVTAPGLMIAATDTKWYHPLTTQVYRFSPFLITSNDTKRYHGDNERVAISNYEQVLNFYHHLILNADQPDLQIKNNEKTEL